MQTCARVRRITLDRPKVNVFDTTMLNALSEALEADWPIDAACAVIDHSGRIFSGGIEVADHIGDTNARTMLAAFRRCVEALARCPVPTIALCRGSAFGGGAELALACDLVLASEDAEFSVPEIRLGVFPPLAAIAWPRVAGSRVTELLLTGEPIGATEAARLGLVTRSVPDGSFEAEAESLVGRFDALSSAALRSLVKVLRRTAESVLDDLAHAERVYLDELMTTEDATEGLQAFVERRQPVWRHA